MNKFAYELGKRVAEKTALMDPNQSIGTLMGAQALPLLMGLGYGVTEPDYPVRTGLGTFGTSALGGLLGGGAGAYAGQGMDMSKEDTLALTALGSLLGASGGGFAGGELIPKYLHSKKVERKEEEKKK